MTGGTVGSALAGTYGSVTINSDGSYSYTLNDADADTNALAQGASVTDVFSYTVTDEHGATSTANLTITITGTNDGPVAVGDSNAGDAVKEAGVQPGGNTPEPGDASASGNVLTNDSDVDTGAVLTVSAVTGGTVGSALAGTYGSVTINSDGSYSYTLDDADAETNALAQGASVDRCVQLHGDRRARRDLDREPDDHHHRHQRRPGGGWRQQCRRCGERGWRATGGNTAEPGDASASGNVLTNDSDVDTGAVLTVSAVTGGTVGIGAGRHLWLGYDQQRRQLQLHAQQCRYRHQRAGAGRLGHRCVQLHGDRRARRHLDREPDHHHHRHQRRPGGGCRHQCRRCGQRGWRATAATPPSLAMRPPPATF